MSGAIDRLPPQNIEAEQGVLGSILLDQSVLVEVRLMLVAGDFYRDDHREIYAAILAVDDRGEPIDGLTVSEELARRGSFERIGHEYLVELLDGVPHAAHARYYAGIVRQKALRREFVAASLENMNEGY